MGDTPESRRSEPAHPDDATDHPDLIVDRNKAIDVAEAAHTDRSKEAFQRAASELKDQYKDRYKKLSWDAASRDPNVRAAAVAAREQLLGELAPKQEELKQRFPESVKSYGATGADWFLDATDDSHELGRPSEHRAEYHAEKAERLEYWAQKVHDSPEAGLTAEECVEIENWIVKNEGNPANRRQRVEAYKEWAGAGQFGLSDALREYQDYFGDPGREEDPNERDKVWLELQNKDETTVGEIKQFLYDRILEDADAWQATVDKQKERLAAVAGDVSPR
jgi:hypothetical protein